MIDNGQDSETLSGSQAPTISGSPPSGPSSPPVAVFRPSLPIGEKFGSYRLLRPLGKGGMGEVYEAEHEETRRRVALKVLSRGLPDPTDRARFLREGRLAASVSHPNSVYIYGTEEIEGTAVIAMELVSGGTLKDRVERGGPMPPREAVDAILQVVEGLEVAAARGVLHRDIKPSNCFVSNDGGVKIGDYGLSMSMLSRAESHLTQTGTFLGTPAFASPEQVRGDKIDVRSDIYSVGATLYYLVTGRAPFEGGGMGKLLSSVLERAPEPPRRLRPELPRGLERAILRCLEKEPKTRFTSYPALREALLPYGTTAPTPATLGLRFGACAIDSFLLNLPVGLPEFVAGWRAGIGVAMPREDPLLLAYLRSAYFFVWAAQLLYFTLLEGLWGASIGKRLFRLRVYGPAGLAPGLPRALLRTAVWQSTGFLALAVAFSFGHRGSIESIAGSRIAEISNLLFILLLFVTARRSNGFAGVHDLLSRTRVIRKPLARRRPVAPVNLLAVADSGYRRVGPYAVLETLSEGATESLLLGYDEQLLRRVWIRTLTVGSPAISAARRDLGRAGRLRWLNGRRSAGEAWDAYEAAEGCPLSEAAARRPGWESVRFWLLDVADELAAGAQDGTLPSVVGLANVWITSDGRAKLLDFPVSSEPDLVLATNEAPEVFLRRVCLYAVRGPVPVYARSFVDALAQGAKADPDRVGQQLRSLLDRPHSVSSRRRVYYLLLCGLLVLCFMGVRIAAWPGMNRLLYIPFVLGMTVTIALLTAFLFRGGLLLRLFGIAVVTRDGAVASRFRTSLRSLVGWSPYWIVALACFGASRVRASHVNPRAILVFGAIILAMAAVWDAWSHPERGFQDRIAGTWLVPR